MQPEEVMMQQTIKPKKEGNKFGLVIAMGIMLFVAAIAGIVFGVYEMLMRNSEVEQAKAECQAAKSEDDGKKESDCKSETKEVKTITNEVAQTLIDPYIMTFNYLNSVFEFGLTEDLKVGIAFRNIDPEIIRDFDKSAISFTIPYSDINGMYKKLFKTSSDLEKKSFSISHSMTFDYSEDKFDINIPGSGGVGKAMFTVVKNAEYTSGGVVVNVYHDVVPICSATEDNYCVDVANSAISKSDDDYNIKSLIEKYASSIPVYQMKFVTSGSHLVLDSINKVE